MQGKGRFCDPSHLLRISVKLWQTASAEAARRAGALTCKDSRAARFGKQLRKKKQLREWGVLTREELRSKVLWRLRVGDR
jgi:hypothetical protein